ncbi:MAG: tRNA (adenosine(37)-N6)-dimethylallyltransferase MiaA [Candidatus Izemoplasma sp.]|nr:tRNA (adenosine(37)-N6)-dimethylallyltransferase MiaA [Candidatus Izemoplasma sp.]
MIVCIVGPTGIGKTELSLQLAKHYDTEIISGDSVQVYKGLDIGSAKVSEEEQAEVKHHLIDIFSPDKQYSVALFQSMVRKKISEFQDKGLMPLIVGGTGLYIKSVLYDYDFTDARRNEDMLKQYNDYSNEALHDVLKEKDPKQAKKYHPNNRKRVLQAISRAGSNKMSQNTNKDTKVYDYLMIGLTMDRQKLHQRIEKRVEQMFEEGLVEEVKQLYPYKDESYALDAIGYKEIIAYLDGEMTCEEAKERIIIHTRQLAKKQYTFFRNQLDVTWVNKDNFDDEQSLLQHVIDLIDKK